MKRKRKGSLTVEATLAFPIYIIAILTIVSFLNIFYTHAVMQQALNNTALRIAEYSYALKVTNTLDPFIWADQADKEINKFKGEVESVSNTAQTAMNSFSNGFTLSTLPDIISDAKDFGDSVSQLATHMGSVKTEDLGKYAVGIFVDAGSDVLVEVLIKSYLEDMNLSLSNVENMDFSMSKFYYGENRDITLVVTYEYRNPLGIKFFDSIKMLQTCTVHPWIGTNG